jgi:hypothetical protein
MVWFEIEYHLSSSISIFSWFHIDWRKIFIYLRSLNVSHFGMVEGTGLRSMALESPSVA